MSEAKYKVGDDVAFHIDGFGPGHGAVQKVTIHYTIKTPGGAVYYREEEDVTPCVRPLAVGDRVRHKYTQKEIGGIVGIRDGRACIWSDLDDDGDCDWNSYGVEYLIRIPTEANQ